MPRSEGIETLHPQKKGRTFADPERMPRSEGIETSLP